MHKIELLEQSKTIKATIIAILIGLCGVMCIVSSVLYITAGHSTRWLSTILGTLGLVGCTLPCFIYRMIVANREKVVNPLIEDKYDEIYEICEKGNKLLKN